MYGMAGAARATGCSTSDLENNDLLADIDQLAFMNSRFVRNIQQKCRKMFREGSAEGHACFNFHLL